ncbi:hypothetical protein [uncultured Microscilla sp.]|uniref:hypothetical protein n=1 Tax=uncultured Microscilla sp. TaxID=432653 RepID=UPI0026303020|nr:hypothetical protein [uncultured Microscilla sp.]
MEKVKLQLRTQCTHYLKTLDKERCLIPNEVNTASLRDILYKTLYLNQANTQVNLRQLDWLTQVTLASLIELLWLADTNIDQQLDMVLDILCEAVAN